MNSNEQNSPFHRSPYRAKPPRFSVKEDTLKCGLFQSERKTFVLALKENPRGRFLRITEAAGEKRNAIIIPSTGLAEFEKLLDEMIEANKGITSKGEPAVSPIVVSVSANLAEAKPAKRTMSEAARAKMSAAAKARWAKIKSSGGKSLKDP